VYLLAVAEPIACTEASLCAAASFPATPPSASYKLREIERSPVQCLLHHLDEGAVSW
jgi:hypothetical protein